MSYVMILDLVAVFVFAISGALAASRNNMDILGYIILASLPAIGGGTMRDVILGAPVFWIENSGYFLVIILAAVLTFILPPKSMKPYQGLECADALGLSLFCVLGASKTLELTSSIPVSVAMGAMTAVAGGILRDVVINEIPLILRKEVYATAALLGSFTFCMCYVHTSNETLSLIIGGAVAFILRGCAIQFKWSLPKRVKERS